MNFETLTLSAAHSLIRPHLPSTLPLESVDRVMKSLKKENVEKFGLFDSGSPNYYTYYPDVTEADMNPSDEEFIYPIYRLLSKVIISPKRLAVDFTDGDVLKESMSLLVGQSIFIDHEDVTGAVMGVVQEVYWQESYTVDGVVIPAGINGKLKIDAKSNPRIARAIMMDPPSIHSTSVTINFGWEKSHNLDDNEFYSLLGTFAKDGKRVRKVVNDINMYFELSLVPHGADPFAKKLKDGKIVLAKQASKLYQLSLSANQVAKEPYMKTLLTGELAPYQMATLSFSNSSTFDTINAINNNQIDETMFEELLLALGYNAEQFADPAALIAHLSALASEHQSLQANNEALTAQVETLTNSNTELTGRVRTLEAEVETLTAQISQETLQFAEVGRARLADVRAEALRFYRLAKGDKVQETIENSINTADLATATLMLTEYQEQYENSVPLSCQDCHSHNVSRRVPTIPKVSKSEAMKNALAEKHKANIKNFLSE